MIKKFLINILKSIIQNDVEIKNLLAKEIVKQEIFLDKINNVQKPLQVELQAIKVEFDDRLQTLEEEQQTANQIQDKLNISRDKKIIELESQFDSIQSQVESVMIKLESLRVEQPANDDVKKTRADVAILFKKSQVKTTELDNKLDAFIDTISDEIAKLKKHSHKK
ncbi:MAG: hypothetical protein Q7R33_05210 [Nitrosarchaeum sp.]|nr:hypothetical protein [Nitrosarchaeum sp.]